MKVLALVSDEPSVDVGSGWHTTEMLKGRPRLQGRVQHECVFGKAVAYPNTYTE